MLSFAAACPGCIARLALHSQRHPAGRPARPGARPFQDDDGRLHRRDPGTVWQAVLLGVTATISHTLIVWGIGLGGMYLWRGVAAEALEPYFQLASGAVIVLIAAWMFWRTWREQHGGAHGHSHDGDHEHLGHMHGPEPHATGHRHDSAFVGARWPPARRYSRSAAWIGGRGRSGCPPTGARQRNPSAIHEPECQQLADRVLWSYGRPYPLPCGRHRAAAVLAAKGNHAGRRAGAVFLDRTGHHLGHRRRSGGAWCASGESECSWISAAALRAPYLQAC